MEARDDEINIEVSSFQFFHLRNNEFLKCGGESYVLDSVYCMMDYHLSRLLLWQLLWTSGSTLSSIGIFKMNQDPIDEDEPYGNLEGDVPATFVAILYFFLGLAMLSVVGIGYGLYYFLTHK